MNPFEQPNSNGQPARRRTSWAKAPERLETATWLCERLDSHNVARLYPDQIERLSEDELIRVIHVSGLTRLLPKLVAHLKYCNRDTLIRLAYLARRCCRNQLD